MDPILKVIAEDEPVSATPQQLFQQADELIQQATALREDADDLRERVKFMYDRADILATTAEGLQKIAFQDRGITQERWDYCLRMGRDDLTIYLSDPENAARFNEMQTRIEDGMVNARDMDTLADSIDDFVESRRAQRSATPKHETSANSEEPALLENLLKSHRTGNRVSKQKIFTNHEDKAGVTGHGDEKETMRTRHDQQSDEDTLINDEAAKGVSDAATDYTNESDEATTDVEECSLEGSQSPEVDDRNEPQVEAEVTDSSDDDDAESSTSVDTHTTDEACEHFDDNSPVISDEQGSESGMSSASNSSSISTSSAETVDTVVVQRAKVFPVKSSKATKKNKTMQVAPQGDRRSRIASKGGVTKTTNQKNKKPKIHSASFWRKQDYTWDARRQLWLHRGRC